MDKLPESVLSRILYQLGQRELKRLVGIYSAWDKIISNFFKFEAFIGEKPHFNFPDANKFGLFTEGRILGNKAVWKCVVGDLSFNLKIMPCKYPAALIHLGFTGRIKSDNFKSLVGKRLPNLTNIFFDIANFYDLQVEDLRRLKMPNLQLFSFTCNSYSSSDPFRENILDHKVTLFEVLLENSFPRLETLNVNFPYFKNRIFQNHRIFLAIVYFFFSHHTTLRRLTLSALKFRDEMIGEKKSDKSPQIAIFIMEQCESITMSFDGMPELLKNWWQFFIHGVKFRKIEYIYPYPTRVLKSALTDLISVNREILQQLNVSHRLNEFPTKLRVKYKDEDFWRKVPKNSQRYRHYLRQIRRVIDQKHFLNISHLSRCSVLRVLIIDASKVPFDERGQLVLNDVYDLPTTLEKIVLRKVLLDKYDVRRFCSRNFFPNLSQLYMEGIGEVADFGLEVEIFLQVLKDRNIKVFTVKDGINWPSWEKLVTDGKPEEMMDVLTVWSHPKRHVMMKLSSVTHKYVHVSKCEEDPFRLTKSQKSVNDAFSIDIMGVPMNSSKNPTNPSTLFYENYEDIWTNDPVDSDDVD